MMNLLIATLAFGTLPLQTCPDNPADTCKVSRELYVRTQFAGNLGLVSFGIGSAFFHNKVTLDLNYGILPKFMNGVRVHTFALKSAFHFKEYTLSGISAGFYIGTSLNYSIGWNIYTKFPGQFPPDYYLPNSIHLNPFIGLQTSFPSNHRKVNKLSLYAELGTIDYKIYYAIRNKNVTVAEIMNLCLGLRIHFKKRSTS